MKLFSPDKFWQEILCMQLLCTTTISTEDCHPSVYFEGYVFLVTVLNAWWRHFEFLESTSVTLQGQLWRETCIFSLAHCDWQSSSVALGTRHITQQLVNWKVCTRLHTSSSPSKSPRASFAASIFLLDARTMGSQFSLSLSLFIFSFFAAAAILACDFRFWLPLRGILLTVRSQTCVNRRKSWYNWMKSLALLTFGNHHSRCILG